VPAPLEEICDTVIGALNTDRRTDDAALLLARFQGIPAGRVASWALEPTARAAGQARRLVRNTLRCWGLGHLTEVAELLATELIGSAVSYAYRPIGLRLLRTDTLTCEVHDDGHSLPALHTVDALSESGRGLSIVNSMAHRWGTNRTETGKVVWFELEPALPGTEAKREQG
jgi:hypothetical protein